MKLFLSAFLLAYALPMASADCPSAGGLTTFTGPCTVANIEAKLACSLNSIGITPAAVKTACDAAAL